ncbi:MAG: thymidylate kinase [Candidatus Acidiferrum sp.]
MRAAEKSAATPTSMTPRGKLIAIEGIDGSGKRTQVELLEQSLLAKGFGVYSTGFPQYDSWFGSMVGNFLNGEMGTLESVDPHFTALLYAGDRFEAKAKLEAALNAGKIVLADRYIGSNLAHQVARAPAAKRSEFVKWIEHLEYTIYGLPRESLVLYLRVPPFQAQALVTRKSARDYTEAKHDLLEASLRHLEEAAELYDTLSRATRWTTIQCFDLGKGFMRLPEEISTEILVAVEKALARKDES